MNDPESASVRKPAVLIIDDDPGTRETFGGALRTIGWQVKTAACGAEARALAASREFHLMLVDLKLPDMPGTDVVRMLHSDRVLVPFVLMSGFLTTDITVRAMRLGAVDVIEKPVEIDDLITTVLSAVGWVDAGIVRRAPHAPIVGGASLAASPDSVSRPRSAAERWASHVVRACQSNGDLKTLREWAAYAGVSYTSLRESCCLIGIRPHEACNLARVLRAVIQAPLQACPPEALLDVSDTRTLKSLLERAGFASGQPLSAAQFLQSQRFVTPDNAGLRVLRTMLGVPPAH